MKSDHESVAEFTKHFDIPVNARLLLDYDWLRFRLARLQEELDETREAMLKCDAVGIFDGLIDLNYISHGTAVSLEFPWASGFTEVHKKNMEKSRVDRAELSRFGSKYDIVKPEHWTPPDLRTVMVANGYPEDLL